MIWTVFLPLLFAICKLINCRENEGPSLSKTRDLSNSATYLSAVYYVNWAIYSRNFNPQDLPAEKLTHVLYAFANISTTGEVSLTDSWADTEKHFAGDSWDETGTNLYGCFKQLYLLKKANRHLKVLLSIGGWSYSTNFAAAASTASGRLAFATTAVSLVADLGLDGLDIDWEYPADDTEAENMVLLLQTVRETLDTYGNSLSPPYYFQLTVACPAGPSHYQTLHLAGMDHYVDFWNLMAYDYVGDWSKLTADLANLFPSIKNSASTPFDTNTTVGNYTVRGIPRSKLVLGMPLYGRSFADTDGLGKPFSSDSSGTWQAGVFDYKHLPLEEDPSITIDPSSGSSYSYNTSTRKLISYDTVSISKQKALWIQNMGLDGAMWWESSADRVGNRSLVANVADVFGGEDTSGLDNSPNQFLSPNSTYDNLRSGMQSSESTLSGISWTSQAISSISESLLASDTP